jgi:hypothetical protein
MTDALANSAMPLSKIMKKEKSKTSTNVGLKTAKSRYFVKKIMVLGISKEWPLTKLLDYFF